MFFTISNSANFLITQMTTLLLKAKSLDSVNEQNFMEILVWCSINQMEMNPGKFQCIVAKNKNLEIPINENTVF